MQTIVRYAKQFVQYVSNNRAVSALEYAILVGIIATALALAVTQFGGDVKETITQMGDALKSAQTTTPDLTGVAPSSTPN